MFCPQCGAQQPDGAEFCGACGSRIGSSAAPAQPRPAAFQAAPQPAAQPAASQAQSAPFGFAAPAPFASPVAGMGKRSLIMLAGAVLTIVLMFQSWVGLPFVDKAIDLAATSAGVSSWAQLIPVAKHLLDSSFGMPDMLGIADGLRGLANVGSTFVMQMGGYGDATAVQQMQSAVGSINLAATILTVVFALWAICLVGLVAGIVLKLFKKLDVVLFASLAASAVLALLCIIATLVLNGQVDGSITQAFNAMGNASVASTLATVKPFIQPAFGAILTLIAAAASTVASLVVKD